MPAMVQIFVLGEFCFLQVVGNRIGKLNLQRLKREFSVVLPMYPVEGLQGVCHFFIAHRIGQGHEIEIVPGGVSLENQNSFDTQYFRIPEIRRSGVGQQEAFFFARFEVAWLPSLQRIFPDRESRSLARTK